MRVIFSFVIFLLVGQAQSQQIILDDKFEDWSGISNFYGDAGDASGLDLEELQISNDDQYLYLRIKVNQEILLQENNAITVLLDFDSNANTGFNFNQIGAEVYFTFGNRSGRMFNVFSDIFHNDIGLISSPTVSNDEFEIAIRRKVTSFTGVTHQMSDQVTLKLYSSGFGGDAIPDGDEVIAYRLNTKSQELPSYNMNKDPDADFRFLSYNVLRDNLFDPALDDEFQAILSNINADVMCFQEIYDHTTQELVNYLASINVIEDVNEWSMVKHGADLLSLVRYPVVYSQPINGNGMFVMDVQGQDVVVINCHLPCCENDEGRESEIDEILEFIRDSKNGLKNYTIEEGTPYIICGDMNFVGNMDQVMAFREGKIFNNARFGPDVTMDWDNDGMGDLTPGTTGFSSSFTWFSPFSSFFPGRLDYIFYTDSRLESMNQFVLNTSGLSVEEQYDYGLFESYSLDASDHMPVVSDFRIRNLDALNSVDADQVNIYPNPSQGEINIAIKGKYIKSLEVFDVNGRIVYKKDNPASKEMLPIEPGVYLIKLSTQSGEIYSHKIHIQ